jgi:hypothetical protein
MNKKDKLQNEIMTLFFKNKIDKFLFVEVLNYLKMCMEHSIQTDAIKKMLKDLKK